MKFKNFSIMVAKLRLLLRLHSTGVSQRQISKQIGLSRTCIRAYLDRMLASGSNADELLKMGDGELLNLAQGEIHRQQPDKRLEILNPLLESYAKESRRRNVTLQLLWEEYYAKYKDDAYSYTTFKHYVQKYITTHTYSYHNEHKPGEVLQIDFAGDHLYLTDPSTGVKSAVVVLCCTLPCSGYSYAQALPDASMENLFSALSKCLSYLGGVPQKLLSDNMKQWVKKRDKDGPIFTDAALEFGAHYSTIIEATQVRKPTHKASVEATVHYLYERVYSPLRDETFYTINDMNVRILDLVDKFNAKKMQNKEYSRLEYFEKNEKDFLNPLPDTSFSLKYTKTGKVGSNYHIYISTHQYSVPYEFVGQEVVTIYDKETVEIYDSKYNRIAVHPRSFKRYGYTTTKEHMPPRHQAYEYKKGIRNANHYLYRAECLDESVKLVIQRILDNAVCIEQAYNSCEAVLQLYKVDSESFISSCRYVSERLKVANAKIIKNVMDTRAYLKTIPSYNPEQTLHYNLRGKDSYMS